MQSPVCATTKSYDTSALDHQSESLHIASADGAPFELDGLGKKLVFVSSKQHVKEISAAPPRQLSFHGFLDDVLHL